jgi:hypothetical protein
MRVEKEEIDATEGEAGVQWTVGGGVALVWEGPPHMHPVVVVSGKNRDRQFERP